MAAPVHSEIIMISVLEAEWTYADHPHGFQAVALHNTGLSTCAAPMEVAVLVAAGPARSVAQP
jgi:hypothetical protein